MNHQKSQISMNGGGISGSNMKKIFFETLKLMTGFSPMIRRQGIQSFFLHIQTFICDHYLGSFEGTSLIVAMLLDPDPTNRELVCEEIQEDNFFKNFKDIFKEGDILRAILKLTVDSYSCVQVAALHLLSKLFNNHEDLNLISDFSFQLAVGILMSSLLSNSGGGSSTVGSIEVPVRACQVLKTLKEEVKFFISSVMLRKSSEFLPSQRVAAGLDRAQSEWLLMNDDHPDLNWRQVMVGALAIARESEFVEIRGAALDLLHFILECIVQYEEPANTTGEIDFLTTKDSLKDLWQEILDAMMEHCYDEADQIVTQVLTSLYQLFSLVVSDQAAFYYVTGTHVEDIFRLMSSPFHISASLLLLGNVILDLAREQAVLKTIWVKLLWLADWLDYNSSISTRENTSLFSSSIVALIQCAVGLASRYPLESGKIIQTALTCPLTQSDVNSSNHRLASVLMMAKEGTALPNIYFSFNSMDSHVCTLVALNLLLTRQHLHLSLHSDLLFYYAYKFPQFINIEHLPDILAIV